MSKKKHVLFICQNCGHQQSQWMGKCSECGSWNSFQEEVIADKQERKVQDDDQPVAMNDISFSQSSARATGISELDRVLGGGVREGSLCLLAGEPGIGKSTLLLLLVSQVAKVQSDKKILYISGEESLSQIANRAKRICVSEPNIYFYHHTSWQSISSHIKKMRPSFIVLDSIQTTCSNEIPSAPGSIAQVREVTFELMNLVKESDTTCFVIGHISKDGAIAGPKILEHMVDTVLYFEGDQFGHYRILRASKNRFGSTNEVGIFEMNESGMKSVKNPSLYFLDHSSQNSYGRSLSMIVEGTRPIFIEVQALVVENKYGNGRRTTQGIDSSRLSMLVAVIEKYLNIPLGFNDIYLNIIGGLKLSSRESDLSMMASILSSYKNKNLDNKLILLGEVGLTGEIRVTNKMEARLKEMSLMGYDKVVAASKTALEFDGKFGIKVVGINHVKELEKIIF